MCYSAQIIAEYKKYVRTFGAAMGIHEYVEIFWRFKEDAKLRLPKAMEDEVLTLDDPQLAPAQAAIRERRIAETIRLEQEVFKQRTRMAKAERILHEKPTKLAANEKRIATDKVAAALARLEDLKRTEPKDRDSRIFPGWFAPVLVMVDGLLVVKPMRYQCRPASAPVFYDEKYPGTYNARRDNLKKFWKGEFGNTHGVMLTTAFFENVNRHRAEGRELQPGEKPENIVLKFEPDTHEPMLVACLWSHWKGTQGEPDLLSFAAITDDPPPEVAAAGHDRCIVPIKPERLMDWLTPGKPWHDYERILDDRERPYYEHRKAA
ncbi:SOS response-associated peptidase family protein [Burkholderiaceae bacterium UC74_6]